MNDVEQYISSQEPSDREVCECLQTQITTELPQAENKVWHGHPVWFLDGNPIVGYSKLKHGVQLMFWSGASFDEPGLEAGTGKFKDASIMYQSLDQVNKDDITRWLQKAQAIQWDYKNIVKRKGVLERLR